MTVPKLPKSAGWMGDPKRGAAMGRADKQAPALLEHKFNLRRIRLNNGGYDSGGAYWGHHLLLYWACNQDHTAEMSFRAYNRKDAKAKIREEYPRARFFR